MNVVTPPLAAPSVTERRHSWWRSGLRVRLFGFGVVVALPLMVLSVLRVYDHKEDSDTRVRESVLMSTTLVVDRIERRIQSTNSTLDVLAEAMHFGAGQRAHNDTLLQRLLQRSTGAHSNYYAYDADGTLAGVAVYSPRLDSLRPRILGLLEQLRHTPSLYIGSRSRSSRTGDSSFVIVFSRGVFSGERLVGAVAVSVTIDSIAQVVDIPTVVPGTVITLFDTAGTVLARSSGGRTTIPDSARVHSPGDFAQEPGVRRFRLRPGDPRSPQQILGHMRTTNAPWFVTVSVPEAEVSAPLRAELQKDIYGAAAAILVALGLAFLIGGRIVRPLDVLATDAETIARGVSSHRSRVSDSSEIGTLATAFNHMADTVERRSAALADSERRYRLLFDSNPLPMWAWDADTLEILAVNEAAIEHYGYDRETFLTLHITDLMDPVDHDRFANSRLPFSEARQSAGSWLHRTSDGRQVEMDVITTSSRRLGRASWLSVGIDITARREAERALARSEEQLRQSQKMEAIGAFAGGIAHDFNNLLTGMLGYCDLALLDVDTSGELHDDIEQIRKLALRGAELTRQILAVSRKQVVQPTVLEPNAVVRGLDRLLARLIGEHIELVTQLGADVGRIKVDAGQLEQVLLNLVANARDAMPSGGVLQIITRAVGASECAAQSLDAQHNWMAIAVRDTGIGMHDHVRERVFEPFFTTKERGKGTGLGLALAYSMVQQCQGEIRVESAPGKGTTFTLYFPTVLESASTMTSGEHAVRNLRGHEVVLVAEDEEAVRNVTTATLQRWGYQVVSAPDGAAALERSREYDGRIDLLLTDVVMPGMNGRELAEHIRLERPVTRVLFVSGYTDDAALLHGIREEDALFLQKPFTPLELARRVRDALDEPLKVH